MAEQDLRVALGPDRVPAHRRTSRWPRVRGKIYPYLLIAPVLLLIALGIVYPLFYMFSLSAYSYITWAPGDTRFVALGNYLKLLNDPELWHALKVSVVWVVGSVVPQFVVGFGMALLLNERFRGRGVVRVLTMLPWVISGVVVGVIWSWLFDGTLGVMNDLLLRLGLIERQVAWIAQPTTAFLVILIANTWRGAPFFAMNLLAAMQGLSGELYEAAKIDGASSGQRFRYLTLPLVLPTIILSTLLSAIWTFNHIDLIWTLTRGGPVNATRSLAIFNFDTAYRDGNFGYSAAISVIMCLFLIVFSALYLRLNRLADTD